jgi:hypothetical protein
MLLTKVEYRNTMTSKFINVTDTASNFDPICFDAYVNKNLVNELGTMNIDLIYETEDGFYRHVVFNTEIKNVHYIIVIDMQKKEILGHHVLNLNVEYGLKYNNSI